MKALGNRARRQEARWRALSVLAVTCAFFATACSSSGNGGANSPESSGSAATLDRTSTTGIASASALEGTWQTGDVSVDDMVSTLRGAGLQKWIQPFRARSGMGDSNVFRLTIADGSWREEYSRDGGPFQDFDDANYTVTGDTVALARGAGSYRWHVAAGTLTLRFVAHSMSGSDEQSGIPGEVLQRAFYTAAPFQRRA